MTKRVAILCNGFGEFNLEASYKKAFEKNGLEVTIFEFDKYLSKYIRFGKIGHILNRFLPVEPWVRKAGREVVLDIRKETPDLVIIPGGTTLQLGMLAFLRTYTKAKILYLWQDPIVNLPTNILDFTGLFDGVASFNKQYVETFEKIGFSNVFWLPLAADDSIHLVPGTPVEVIYDLSFIGGWRPEREHTLEAIIKRFPELRVVIWGTDWKQKCASKLVLGRVNTNAIRGSAFAEKINQSLISLNVIDEAGFPAANMRSFEIPVAGGLQLSTVCPELKNIFRDGKEIVFFRNDEELFEKIQYCLDHKEELLSIRKASQEKVLEGQLYVHRAEEIIKRFGL